MYTGAHEYSIQVVAVDNVHRDDKFPYAVGLKLLSIVSFT